MATLANLCKAKQVLFILESINKLLSQVWFWRRKYNIKNICFKTGFDLPAEGGKKVPGLSTILGFFLDAFPYAETLSQYRSYKRQGVVPGQDVYP